MFLMVNLVLIILRYQQPLASRPFRVSFSVGWLPIVPCLGILATLALSQQLDLWPTLVAFALLLGGLALYAINQTVK